MRLGILGSTKGSNLSALINAAVAKKLPASIAVVVSNKSNALILARGEQHAIPACFINPENMTREHYDEKITKVLQQFEVDLVLLIGYMRILSGPFIAAWRNKILNVHPSLLPKHAGKMDLAVHKAVLDANEVETGCTVHYVTEEVDKGPVLLQKKTLVYPFDTPETLKKRVQALEASTLIEAIQRHYLS